MADLMPSSVAMRGRAGRKREPSLAEEIGGFFSHPQPEQTPEYGGDPRLAGGFEFGSPTVAAPSTPAASPKEAERAAHAAVAAGTAENARTDPAGGTAQGASQPYSGTGDAKSKTGTTGGVTTGAPGRMEGVIGGASTTAKPKGPDSHLKVKLPSGEWAEFGDPRIEASFGGRGDTFMKHRERTATPSGTTAEAPGAGGAPYRPSPVETYSAVPLAAQLENWNTYVTGRDLQQQQVDTAMAQGQEAEQMARAGGRRAEILAEEPFYAEELAARAKTGEAKVKAGAETAERNDLKLIADQAAQQVNKLRMSPQYQLAPPEQRKQMEDQIWDQARLTLSALTRTNLYPRPDPYAILGSFGAGQPAAAPGAKPAS